MCCQEGENDDNDEQDAKTNTKHAAKRDGQESKRRTTTTTIDFPQTRVGIKVESGMLVFDGWNPICDLSIPICESILGRKAPGKQHDTKRQRSLLLLPCFVRVVSFVFFRQNGSNNNNAASLSSSRLPPLQPPIRTTKRRVETRRDET